MQQQHPRVQGISAGSTGQSIDGRVARLIPPEVIEATRRMYGGGTESDAMLYTAALATAMLSLAKMQYRNSALIPPNEADRSTADSALMLSGLADWLDESGFHVSAEHARAVSEALWGIRTLNMVLGRGSMSGIDGGDATKTYIIKSPASGLIKIGKSVNPAARIKGLSTAAGCKLDILAVIDDDIENELHKRFADIRVYGEWFRDDGRISAFAVEVAA